MGKKTALLLSLKNLFSKKARTILTSVAGSIGIIGVALVLALSNGFNTYMSQMQTDTLASFPLTISESSVDLSSFNKVYEDEVKEKFPKLNNVIVEKAFSNLTGMLSSNDLTDASEEGFLHYLKEHQTNNPDYYYTISYDYGFDMNKYFYTDVTYGSTTQFISIDSLVGSIQAQYDDSLQAAMGISTDFVRQYIPTITEMPDYELIKDQYDVLYGYLPEFNAENSNKMVLVVDEYNGISDITLALLGYLGINIERTGSDGVEVTFTEKQEISVEEIVNRVINGTKNGSIILFHNGVENTAPALDKILTELGKQGYSFVSVEELIYKDNYTIDHTGRQYRTD
jgi:putative ABC transport system permease protein